MKFLGNKGIQIYMDFFFGNLGKERYTNIHGIFGKFREIKVYMSFFFFFLEGNLGNRIHMGGFGGGGGLEICGMKEL
jgi:hypothetical protein